jgi:ATP-dependent helicase HepA
MTEFKPGQRWISESEPELGLGMVLEVEHRRVQILFPAGGEMRHYAADSTPLKRVRFKRGDTLQPPEGPELVVESVREEDGVLTYCGGGRELPEAALADTLSFNQPDARLLSGRVDENQLFDLRLATLQHRHRICRSSVRGFLGGRVELIPHQLYIAREVSRRQVPRVLLADEVGLGKTIEASLFLTRSVVPLLKPGRKARTRSWMNSSCSAVLIFFPKI